MRQFAIGTSAVHDAVSLISSAGMRSGAGDGVWVPCSSIPVEFARVYLGFHYFSDILAGTLIGVAISGLLVTEYPRSLVAKHILPVADRNPQYFYPALVSYLYMVAMVFDPLRDILHYIHAITRAFFARLFAMMHNSRWGFEEVGLIVAIGCVIILILAVRGRSANRAIGTNSNL